MEQNEPNFLDRSTLLAILLSFGIFVGWQAYMQKKYPKKNKTTVSQSQEINSEKNTLGPQSSTNATSGQEITASKNLTKSKSSEKTLENSIEAPSENVVQIQGSQMELELSNYGMGFRQVRLLQYSDRGDQNITFPSKAYISAEGEESNSSPEGIIDEQENSSGAVEKAMTEYGLEKQGLFSTVYNGKPLIFSIEKIEDNKFKGVANVHGAVVNKSITINDKTYSADVDIQVILEQASPQSIEIVFYDFIVNQGSSWFAPAYEGTEFFNISEGSSSRERQTAGTAFSRLYKEVSLASIGSQYFSLSLVDKSPILPSVQSTLLEVDKRGLAKSVIKYTNLPGQKNISAKYTLFLGPKDHALLGTLDEKLVEVVDYGFFSFISKPILKLLKFLYSVLGNWGISIIFLTIFIRLLLLPVAISSVRSMKKMQKIQPVLKELRERFKDDPQKMNVETMALMKKSGANPLGGCLPMFAQIPVFFALYSVLGQSIELYKSPFILWIQDLSFKDPFFVLPIAVSLLYLVQMKMTPSGMDPSQKKIMMMMPLVFGVFMLSLPSGLTLYFLVNTLFGIGQQVYINQEKTA